MNKEYLENYKSKEDENYSKFLINVMNDKSGVDTKYPPDSRFIKLQEPVATCGSVLASNLSNICAQIPFTGSVIMTLPAITEKDFEENICSVDYIPKIIEFIKDTGKLQVTLSGSALQYIGLDYLDPFFKELNPPSLEGASPYFFGPIEQAIKAIDTFRKLSEINLLNYVGKTWSKTYPDMSLPVFLGALDRLETAYSFLKIHDYKVVPDIENLIVDDPEKAISLLTIYRHLITDPGRDLRSSITNLTLKDINNGIVIPNSDRPRNIIPCEVGKFLLTKLTYAPQSLRGCYYLLDNFKENDLQKIQKSLNEAIVTSNPDLAEIKADELSKVLDNLWNDKTIQNRLSVSKVVASFSVAAVGGLTAGLGGATVGLLAGLGFNVLDKTIDAGDKFFEKISKMQTKNYQIDIFDFKKDNKSRLPKGS